MGRVVLAVDAGVGVTVHELIAASDRDEQASAVGPVRVEAAGGQVFLPGLVEWVVLPLAVNLASSVLYDLVKRVLGRARASVVSEVEVVESVSASGDRLVVVRLRQVVP